MRAPAATHPVAGSDEGRRRYHPHHPFGSFALGRHVHMLTPLDYRDDCEVMIGRLLSHDAQLDKTELAEAFENTKSLWHTSRGEPYVYQPPPDARRDYGWYAGCGSCGWGDSDFHAQLGHPQEEASQIAHAYDAGGSRDESEGAAVPSSDVSNGEGVVISEAWASDAPSHAASGGGGEGVMSDPWAAPASASSVDDAMGWGDSSSDGGGDSGSCGGGCGGGCGGD